MHNKNRWAAFNAVINGNEAVMEILDKKNIIDKPTISEEMMEDIERNIIISYQNQNEISFKYYTNHKITEITGTITKLDPINKRIILNNHISLYFANIIDILEKNT